MKHYCCSKVVCPYYKHEDSQVIYCEGIVSNSVVHIAFANKTDAVNYKKTYCRDCYQECRVFEMLNGGQNEQKK